MYNHIIGIDDELWDIIEEGVSFEVNEESVLADRKKTYKKHPRVRGILMEALPHAEYM